MFDPRFLKKAVRNCVVYPDVQSVDCDMLGTDNKVYGATFPKEELELGLYLKTTVFKKLSETEQTELLRLINEYGDTRYENGAFNESYDG